QDSPNCSGSIQSMEMYFGCRWSKSLSVVTSVEFIAYAADAIQRSLVSLRQSGVGTGFVRADATLPKGHLRAGLDFIGRECGGGAFRRRRSSLRRARRQECWYASGSSGATSDKLIARRLGNSESR